MKLNTYKIFFRIIEKPEITKRKEEERRRSEKKKNKNNDCYFYCGDGLMSQMSWSDDKRREYIFITSHSMAEAVKYAEEHLVELTKDMKFNKEYNLDKIEEVCLEHETTII